MYLLKKICASARGIFPMGYILGEKLLGQMVYVDLTGVSSAHFLPKRTVLLHQLANGVTVSRHPD